MKKTAILFGLVLTFAMILDVANLISKTIGNFLSSEGPTVPIMVSVLVMGGLIFLNYQAKRWEFLISLPYSLSALVASMVYGSYNFRFWVVGAAIAFAIVVWIKGAKFISLNPLPNKARYEDDVKRPFEVNIGWLASIIFILIFGILVGYEFFSNYQIYWPMIMDSLILAVMSPFETPYNWWHMITTGAAFVCSLWFLWEVLGGIYDSIEGYMNRNKLL